MRLPTQKYLVMKKTGSLPRAVYILATLNSSEKQQPLYINFQTFHCTPTNPVLILFCKLLKLSMCSESKVLMIALVANSHAQIFFNYACMYLLKHFFPQHKLCYQQKMCPHSLSPAKWGTESKNTCKLYRE